MGELTQATLEQAIADLATLVDNSTPYVMKPTQLIVPQSMFKLARRIVFPHRILKARKGVRGRAMTLKWRRK